LEFAKCVPEMRVREPDKQTRERMNYKKEAIKCPVPKCLPVGYWQQ
jgi:hypothetical protein